MRRTTILKTAAVALGTVLGASAVQATAVTDFTLNTPYGTNIDAFGQPLAALDWLPGAGLAVNTNLNNPPVDNPFEFLFQLRLGSILNNANQAVPTPTLNGPNVPGFNSYEFTAVGRLWETFSLSGNTINFNLAPGTVADPNILQIYADKYDGTGGQGAQANVAAGTGYTDGALVLTATPYALINSTFTTSDTNGNGMIDNQDTGAGSAQMLFDVVSYDPTFWTFQGVTNPGNFRISLFVTQHFEGTINTPPDSTMETALMWDGTPTDYYKGGPTDTTQDLLFKVDGNAHFTPIPEPGTMVLLGTGLLGLAGAARRRMKK